MFTAFQGLHVSLIVGTLFTSLVEKVEILICRAVKARAPIISVRSQVWAFLCKDGRFSSELLLLSHVKVNVFIARHNVIRTNFLEINQVLNIRTLSTPDVKIRIGLIALLAARHCTERFWSITKDCWVGFFVGFLVRFEVSHCVIIVPHHSWLSIRVYQCNEKLLTASHWWWVKDVMVWAVLALLYCVIKVRCITCTVKTIWSITGKGPVSRTNFPYDRVVSLNFLFLFLERS